MSLLTFSGWRKFWPYKDKPLIRRWMRAVGDESTKHFKAGLLGPHTGVIRGKALNPAVPHQASVNRAGAEFPANDSGKLLKSLRAEAAADKATVGTSMYYSKFLAEGTRLMKRRRMSKEALQYGARKAKPKSRGWIGWKRTRSTRRS